MNKKVIIGTLMGCLFGATVGYSASVINLPHTFTAGTPIKASEVNANFAALAQEIANVALHKSSDFAEIAVTPVSAAIGSTITVGAKSYVMKQRVGLEDIVTGKKYRFNYLGSPSAGVGNTEAVFYTADCKAIVEYNVVVRVVNGNGFTSYVILSSITDYNASSPAISVGVYVQLTNNICAIVGGESSFDFSHATESALIDRVVELQKYTSVQEM